MTRTSISTRERLVTEATRLFSDKGFEATSVSQIEAAAGLAAGSGALYRHFKSKDDLLTACIDRQLDRRSAMRQIRKLFSGLSDLHSELAIIGRYLLSLIDDEIELMKMAARTPPGLSKQLDNAHAALLEALHDELTDWIRTWAPHATIEQAELSAAVCLNSLLGGRYATRIVRQSDSSASDEAYVKEWATLLAARLRESFG